MSGRTPKLDGRKAMEGGRGIDLAPLDPHKVLKPPANLGAHGRAAWRQAAKSLIPARVVSHGDLLALEAMCKAWDRWKRFEEKIEKLNALQEFGGELTKTPNGHLQMSALRISADRALKQFSVLAREFGLTPVARVRTAGTAQGDFLTLLDAQMQPRRRVEAHEPDPTDPYGAGAMH